MEEGLVAEAEKKLQAENSTWSMEDKKIWQQDFFNYAMLSINKTQRNEWKVVSISSLRRETLESQRTTET